MTVPSTTLFPANIAGAIQDLSDPTAITGQAFSYPEAVMRILGAWNMLNITRSSTQPGAPVLWDIWLKPAILTGTTITPAELKIWDGAAFIDIEPGHFLANMGQDAVTNAITIPGLGGGAATLTAWTTATRPAAPAIAETGFNTDLGSLETWSGAAWLAPGGGATLPADTEGLLHNDGAGALTYSPSSWATAGRPATPYVGQNGFNTDLGKVEAWNGTSWVDVGGVTLPPESWTTATRPAVPVVGQQGYNATLDYVEYWDGAAWVQVGGVSLSPTSWATVARPTTPSVGQSGYNTDLSSVEVWNGVAWVGVGGGAFSASAAAPLTPGYNDLWYSTTDDILYAWINDGTSDLWLDISSFSAGGSATVTSAAVAPATPNYGDLWFETAGEVLYVWINDGTSDLWLDISGAGGGSSGLDITGLAAIAVLDGIDEVAVYDVSGAVNGKATIDEIAAAVAASDGVHSDMFFYGSF